MTADRAISFSCWQIIHLFTLEQALRLVIPTWSNKPIFLIKTSVVVLLIAVEDLTVNGKRAAFITYNPIGSYLPIAVIYLVMVFPMNALLKLPE